MGLTRQEVAELLVLLLIVVNALLGVVARYSCGVPLWLDPQLLWTYILSHLAVLVMVSRVAGSRAYLVLMVGSIVGFLCEVTGTSMGRYEYGSHYVLKIHNVPLEVTVMWVYWPLSASWCRLASSVTLRGLSTSSTPRLSW